LAQFLHNTVGSLGCVEKISVELLQLLEMGPLLRFDHVLIWFQSLVLDLMPLHVWSLVLADC
jgi:hypothetical protein